MFLQCLGADGEYFLLPGIPYSVSNPLSVEEDANKIYILLKGDQLPISVLRYSFA